VSDLCYHLDGIINTLRRLPECELGYDLTVDLPQDANQCLTGCFRCIPRHVWIDKESVETEKKPETRLFFSDVS
jgi:hypothetical protein